MKIEIKNINNKVIFGGDFPSLMETVIAALQAKVSLVGANLSETYLRQSNTTEEELAAILSLNTIAPTGTDLTGWKKLRDGTICELLIPAAARRVGGLIGRKCRAEAAKVVAGEGPSRHLGGGFMYKVGEIVQPREAFNYNPCIECGEGIHFFITRREAETFGD